jgi:5-amino-6-(5-phosphoribosylamino)uracil reductase
VSEDYRPPKLSEEYRALNISNPRLAVLSRSLSFDLTTRLFSDYDNRPIIFTQISADEIWLENLRNLKDFADVEVLADPMDLANVVKILNQLNYQKIVCEGGPNLLAQLLALDLVDELDLTQSPVSTGSATKISKSELEATRQISSIISTWPNRITAKLGQHAVSRIKR